jgi:hypothetical protein
LLAKVTEILAAVKPIDDNPPEGRMTMHDTLLPKPLSVSPKSTMM